MSGRTGDTVVPTRSMMRSSRSDSGTSCIAAAIGLCLLTACASTPAPVPTVTVSCPPLKSYSTAQEQAVATALQGLPAGSPLVGFITDYGQLRAAVRACQKP